MLAQGFAEQADQFAAAGGGDVTPSQAGLPRAGDGGVGLGHRVLMHLRQFGAVDRAAGDQGAAGERTGGESEIAQDVLRSVHAGSFEALRSQRLRLRVMPKWRFWKKIYYTKL